MSPDTKPVRFPFLKAEDLRSVAIVCHRNSDPDAYLSAFALSKLIRTLSPSCEVVIVTPGGMTVLTQKLNGRFPHKTVEQSSEDFDLFIAVDVGDEALLNEWKDKMKSSSGVKVLVDHHPLRDGGLYDRTVVDENATSAAEVVFTLFEGAGALPDGQTSQALLEAILFDSSHLAIAGQSGLRTVVKLLEGGADIDLARRELRSEPDYGEVLAKLKGAQRLEIHRVGDWVVATSRVGSFQAHVARALVHLGADLALVGGESEGETRVSLRSTQRFLDGTGMKLGAQVAEEMSKRLGGHGGGHSTAASFSTQVDEEEALGATMKRIGELLGKIRKVD